MVARRSPAGREAVADGRGAVFDGRGAVFDGHGFLCFCTLLRFFQSFSGLGLLRRL